uniref:SH3 domain-containing protein n=1 Tax=Clytia hemisphaerica TaxID=252671 RepID=A0A7M5X0L1_9CNID
MAGTVVKCIFAFTGEVDTDLSLDVGDLIKITKVLSDDWYEGTCNGRNGQFPKAFVEKTSEVFEMALAITHFPGEEKGDLPLNEGDVVIITEIIDDNWAVGHTHGGHKGTFPRAFVKEISFEDSVMKNALQAAVEPMETAVEENSDVSVEQEECNDESHL